MKGWILQVLGWVHDHSKNIKMLPKTPINITTKQEQELLNSSCLSQLPLEIHITEGNHDLIVQLLRTISN